MNDDVAEVVRAVLATAVVSGSRPPTDLDRPLWTELERGGFTLLAMAEERGGGGGTLVDAATVVHEAAYAGAAVPVAEVAMIAGPLLDAAGLTAPAGPVTVATGDGVSAYPGGDAIRLSGSANWVPWLRWCDTVLVVVGDPPRQSLAVVRTDGAGVSVTPAANLAGEPRDTLVLDRAPAAVVPLPPGDWTGWVRQRGALARAVQLAAAATRVRDVTIAFVGTREQFGRRIAAFQAVQHRLVELASVVVVMRGAVDSAVAAASTGTADAPLLAAIAKAETSAVAGTVAAAGHQLHGAIGFTLEHDLGAATKRLWSWRDEFGAENHWREAIAAVVAEHDAPLWHLITGPTEEEVA